jgi:glyoxylase-like metal-dependent hydrolase (beta-lactamase superfamily II)
MAASHHLLHAGYVRDDGVAGSVSLVIDDDATIVVDPGMVSDRDLILAPLLHHGIEPERVMHVVITHHHPDHTVNIGLFPKRRWSTSGPAIEATGGSTMTATGIGSAGTRVCS